MTTDQSPNIVLTGFMGTGKTTVGRVLAKRLGFAFVDTDAIIEDRHGPIPAIFETQGEVGFRDLERAVAAELASGSNTVIATGGRLMLDPTNADALSATGRVFCLAAEPDEIVRRVTGGGVAKRPLLAGDDPAGRIIALLEERAAGYGAFEQVPTTDRSPKAIAADIVDRLARGVEIDPTPPD